MAPESVVCDAVEVAMATASPCKSIPEPDEQTIHNKGECPRVLRLGLEVRYTVAFSFKLSLVLRHNLRAEAGYVIIPARSVGFAPPTVVPPS